MPTPSSSACSATASGELEREAPGHAQLRWTAPCRPWTLRATYPTGWKRSGEATYEVLNRKRDGTPLWCRAHTSAFDHPEYGKVWVAVHEDITERKRADVLERSFIPERLPEIPGVQLAARFIPGGAGVEVGGDWYDVLEIDDGSIGLVIGDVAGRGVSGGGDHGAAPQRPARLRPRVASARHRARASEQARLEPRGSVMATLIYLVFDPGSGQVRVRQRRPPAAPAGETRRIRPHIWRGDDRCRSACSRRPPTRRPSITSTRARRCCSTPTGWSKSARRRSTTAWPAWPGACTRSTR